MTVDDGRGRRSTPGHRHPEVPASTPRTTLHWLPERTAGTALAPKSGAFGPGIAPWRSAGGSRSPRSHNRSRPRTSAPGAGSKCSAGTARESTASRRRQASLRHTSESAPARTSPHLQLHSRCSSAHHPKAANVIVTTKTTTSTSIFALLSLRSCLDAFDRSS
jgi:hypothetical protein